MADVDFHRFAVRVTLIDSFVKGRLVALLLSLGQ